MEDEVSSCENMEGKENREESSSTLENLLSTGVNESPPHPHLLPEKLNRKPMRQRQGSPNRSPSSSSGKKKPLQKQKSGGKKIKCVLIGDSKTGKSALVRSFLHGQSVTRKYVPTTQDIHVFTPVSDSGKSAEPENCENKDPDNANCTLQIYDTGGQPEMDRLRPLCYGQAQMVVICFSVMNPASFANVTSKWLPEVKRHCMVSEDPENPLKLLLVGTQSDLRSNVNILLKLMDDGLAPISEARALRLANKIGALQYVESSCVTQNNVNHIFDLVMTYGDGKVLPKQLTGVDMAETGFHGKILPHITERKLMFWRRWKGRQNKSSKMKRLVILPCLF